MFRSSAIIRELVLSLAKVMLEHNITGYSNITLARHSTSSLMMVEDQNM
jgi:hypothetical protein